MWCYPPGWVTDFIGRREADDRKIRQLERLAERVYGKARAGGIVTYPVRAIHHQCVTDMFGGAAGWEAMTADLDIARQEFSW